MSYHPKTRPEVEHMIFTSISRVGANGRREVDNVTLVRIAKILSDQNLLVDDNLPLYYIEGTQPVGPDDYQFGFGRTDGLESFSEKH